MKMIPEFKDKVDLKTSDKIMNAVEMYKHFLKSKRLPLLMDYYKVLNDSFYFNNEELLMLNEMLSLNKEEVYKAFLED